jgi:predicted DNA-binding protein
MTTDKKRLFTVYLTEDQYQKLKKVSKHESRTMTSTIRNWIEKSGDKK